MAPPCGASLSPRERGQGVRRDGMNPQNRISVFAFPNHIVFGVGAFGELGAETKRLGMTRPLLVTDRGVVACGLAERVALEAKRAGLALAVFDGTSPNPIEQN